MGSSLYLPPYGLCPTNMDYASGPFREPCKKAPRCWGLQAIHEGLAWRHVNTPPLPGTAHCPQRQALQDQCLGRREEGFRYRLSGMCTELVGLDSDH